MKLRWMILFFLVATAAAQIPCMSTVTTTPNLALGLMVENPNFIGVAGYSTRNYDLIINQDWACVDTYLSTRVAVVPCANTTGTSQTTNFKFNIPARGATGWDVLENQNWTCVDSLINGIGSGGPCFTSGTVTTHFAFLLIARGIRNWASLFNQDMTCLDKFLFSGTFCGPQGGYTCTTSTVFNPGTVPFLFVSTSPTATTCSGQCQNTVAYDTTLNATSDAITRMTDGASIKNGQSIGNGTCSGGDVDGSLISSLGNYIAPVASGSGELFHIGIVNRQVKVLSPLASVPAIIIPCEFSFGLNSNDALGVAQGSGERIIYFLQNHHQLMYETFSADASTITFGPTQLFDFTAAGACPGMSGFTGTGLGTATGETALNIDTADNTFVVGLSNMVNGLQGSPYMLFAYQASTNSCATLNLNTGQSWAYCNSSCGSASPVGTIGTAAADCWGVPIFTGTVNTSGNTVTWVSGNQFTWSSLQKDIFINNTLSKSVTSQSATSLTVGGSAMPTLTGVVYYVIIGMHGTQVAGDGSRFFPEHGANGPWTQGGCSTAPDSNATGIQSWYQIGTTNDAYVTQNSPYFAGSHADVGMGKVMRPSFNGFNIRTFAQYSTSNFNYLMGPPPWADIHFFWAHNVFSLSSPDDNGFGLGASDSPSTASGCTVPGNTSAVYCPAYGQGITFGINPNGLSSAAPSNTGPFTPPKIFAHTGTCGGGNNPAVCNSGANPAFGENNTIGAGDPQGRFFCWVSSWFAQMGTDNNGNARADLFCGMCE